MFFTTKIYTKEKRVFIIGNGPYLSDTDLDLIKDEYSIS